MNNNDDKRQSRFLDKTSAGAASPPDKNARHLQWLRLAQQLSPLIGENGFCALYMRALRLAQPQFDWLTGNQSGKSSVEQLLEALMNDLATVDAASAERAHSALLKTFTQLLTVLIGEALTIRLLDSASTGEHERKNAQEQK
jgi:hypothetical protein